MKSKTEQKINHRTEIVNGNSGVIIINDDGFFMATLWVNVRNGFHDADICDQRWSGSTFNGAVRWAKKQVGLL